MNFQNINTARLGPLPAATSLSGRANECARLERLLADTRAGHSTALILRGQPGIGKTALLDHMARRATGCRVIRAQGAESDMDLPYAGLHLVCASMLDRLGCLPSAQRAALGAAVGATEGAPLDRFQVGLATLNLLARAARTRPILCLVDDAQWLDNSSARVLAFVARRLEAESVAFVLAERDTERCEVLDGLPELRVSGLCQADARALLGSLVPGRVDEQVAKRILAEARGNPRALLEQLHGVTPAQFAGGFGVPPQRGPLGRAEEKLLALVADLPQDSRQLMLLAAAEPVGDPALCWRAATRLAIPPRAAEPLESAGLLALSPRVAFHHPPLRSACYATASREERRTIHSALAEATDPATDPDRWAWHRAHAAKGPDEELAVLLELRVATARARGGPAAAAAFLELAALLTPDPARRAARALHAAAAKQAAGDPEAVVRLLVTAEMGMPDAAPLGHMERQRALATGQRHPNPDLLLQAARQLERVDAPLARETYLEALEAAIRAGRLAPAAQQGTGWGPAEVAEAARAGSGASASASPVDLLLNGLTVRFTVGYRLAVEPLRRAVSACRNSTDTAGLGLAGHVAAELWDDEAWHALTSLQLRLARDTGALAALPPALTDQALVELHRGDLASAAALVDEAGAVAARLGNAPPACAALLLAAWRGQRNPALELIGRVREDACRRGEGLTLASASLADAVLYNGLGRYEEALAAAREATGHDDLGRCGAALAELVEAAARAGESRTALLAVRQLRERTEQVGTDWALGVEAYCRALLCDGQAAADLYLEAVGRLERTSGHVQLARARLVYGEWLRRQGRRIDARGPLRAAADVFAAAGAEAFAERAHRELVATGERVRSRVAGTSMQLTPQEVQVALLASEGLTNPEIGARLYLSPRTAEYHLHKVFTKLGIRSRTQLHLVLTEHPAPRLWARPASPPPRMDPGSRNHLLDLPCS